jgi:hypothetical protein
LAARAARQRATQTNGRSLGFGRGYRIRLTARSPDFFLRLPPYYYPLRYSPRDNQRNLLQQPGLYVVARGLVPRAKKAAYDLGEARRMNATELQGKHHLDSS